MAVKINGIKNAKLSSVLGKAVCKVNMEPEYLNLGVIGFYDFKSEMDKLINSKGKITVKSVREIAELTGGSSLSTKVLSAIASFSVGTNDNDSVEIDKDNYNKILEEVKKYMEGGFVSQLFYGFTHTIKTLFFNPNCRNMSDVVNYIGITPTKEDMQSVVKQIFNDKKTEQSIQNLKDSIEMLKDVSEVLKNYKNILPESINILQNVVNVQQTLENITKIFEEVKNADSKNLSAISKNVNVDKLINNFNNAQSVLTTILEQFSEKGELYNAIKKDAEKTFNDIKNTIIPLILTYTNNVDDFVNELNKILNTSDNHLFKSIIRGIINNVNKFKNDDNTITQMSLRDFVQKYINNNDNIIQEALPTINKKMVLPSQVIIRNIEHIKGINEFNKSDMSDIKLPFYVYYNLVMHLITQKGYNVGKFYPSVEYIKQHFGEDNPIVTDMIQKYLNQTTVFLKTVMQTCKYPIDLLTFDSLLKYQKLIGDNSVLTPERINQLRGQIIQIIDFMQLNDLDISKKVNKSQIKQLLQKEYDNNNIKIDNNIVDKTVENINNVVILYNEYYGNKKTKELIADVLFDKKKKDNVRVNKKKES